MAMLADSRRRRRYNLQPRGKPLYENDDHFGKKMLEKMGWSKGKGLGAKEDGIKEFVKVHYKNNAQGLGYAERDDQWTQHEEHFTGLLNVLNKENGPASQDSNTAKNGRESEMDSKWNDKMVNATMGFGFKSFQEERANAISSIENEEKQEEMKKQISGISLEEMSKQSKARVHYKKFTKGKDLTQYSEKDLANIFGKKGTEFCHNNTTSIKMKSSHQNSKKHNNNLNDCIKTIQAPLPINEYFNEEMVRKLKHQNNFVDNNQMPSNELSMDVGMNQNGKDAALNQSTSNNMININVLEKRKKKRINEASNDNSNQCDSNNTKCLDETSKVEVTDSQLSYIKQYNESNDQMNKRKKNKKRKHNEIVDKEENVKEGNTFVVATEIMEESTPIMKEKKANKRNRDPTEVLTFHSSGITNDDKENDVKSQDLLQNVDDYEKVSIDLKIQENVSKQIHEPNKLDYKGEMLEKQKKKRKHKAKEIKDTEPIKLNANGKLDKEDVSSIFRQELEQSIESLENVKNNTKKRKKNNTNDLDDYLEIKATEDDEHVLSACNSKKKKKKRHYKEINNDVSSMVTTTNGISEQKSSSSDLPDDNNRTTINNSSMSIEELKAKYDTFNLFTISSFCAEKFRNVDVEQFSGASLNELNGYALNDETQLNVKYIQHDDERITNLWKCILDKYEGLEKPKKTYRTYMKEVHKARIHKQKKPKLHVKTWKRKNVFCAL